MNCGELPLATWHISRSETNTHTDEFSKQGAALTQERQPTAVSAAETTVKRCDYTICLVVGDEKLSRKFGWNPSILRGGGGWKMSWGCWISWTLGLPEMQMNYWVVVGADVITLHLSPFPKSILLTGWGFLSASTSKSHNANRSRADSWKKLAVISSHILEVCLPSKWPDAPDGMLYVCTGCTVRLGN